MTPLMPLLIFLLVRFIYIAIENSPGANNSDSTYNILKRRYKMNFRFNRKISNLNMLFNGHYIDVKALYVLRFSGIPCVSFIGETDATKAYAYINNTFGADIKQVYQHRYFDHDHGGTFFNNTIFIMTNERMVEIGSNYCHLLHNDLDYDWARQTLEALAAFRLATTNTAQTQVIGFAKQTSMNNN